MHHKTQKMILHSTFCFLRFFPCLHANVTISITDSKRWIVRPHQFRIVLITCSAIRHETSKWFEHFVLLPHVWQFSELIWTPFFINSKALGIFPNLARHTKHNTLNGINFDHENTTSQTKWGRAQSFSAVQPPQRIFYLQNQTPSKYLICSIWWSAKVLSFPILECFLRYSTIHHLMLYSIYFLNNFDLTCGAR